MAKSDLYNKLYSAVKLRYSDLPTASLKTKTNRLWVDLKEDSSSNKSLRARINEEIAKLKTESPPRKVEVTFSIESPKRIKREITTSPIPTSSTLMDVDETDEHCISPNGNETPKIEEDTIHNETNSTKKPAQETARAHIVELEKKLESLYDAQESGLATDETESLIAEAKVKLEEERRNLRYLEGNAARSKRYRDTQRSKLFKIIDNCPQAATVIRPKRTRGRPRIEDDQPGLLELISHIAAVNNGGSGISEKSELIQNCKTLDDLTSMIQDHGYNIKRSALYLRLTSLKNGSILKQRPTQRTHLQPGQRKKHVDADFTTTSIQALESLASYLGPDEVVFLSRDCNSRVPLGITTKNKQQAILLQMDYGVKADRDWLKEDKHKLIPSIYTGIVIKEDGYGDPAAITYTGPTFITVRSGKHSSPNANSHALDLDASLNSVVFEFLCKTKMGSVKPVLILLVDGGPNSAEENPRYFKVIKHMINHFKKYDLDALYMVTNAPGRRSFDRFEHRIEELGKELSGLILPVEFGGDHLNILEKPNNNELENRNFKHAGDVLSEVWSELRIDDHSVKAVYIEEDKQSLLHEVDPLWYAAHVRESQYLLQIVKCDSIDCCGIRRSSLQTILPSGFLPPPIKVKKNPETKVGFVESKDQTGKFLPLFVRLSAKIQHDPSDFKQVPYDLQCPSLRSELKHRICKVCDLYFSSKKSATTHTKLCHNEEDSTEISTKQPLYVTKRRLNEVLCIVINDEGKEEAEWIDINDIDNTVERELLIDEGSTIPAIKDVSQWVTISEMGY